MPFRSEIEFHRSLKNAWRRRTDGVAECRAADVAIDRSRPVELCVVEDIECLDAEEERRRLFESQTLGSGVGYVLRNGEAIKVTWHRRDELAPTTYTTAISTN